jgi:hypothetical protein
MEIITEDDNRYVDEKPFLERLDQSISVWIDNTHTAQKTTVFRAFFWQTL